MVTRESPHKHISSMPPSASAEMVGGRPDSALSEGSKKSVKSDRSAIRKEVLRLYKSEELPSLYARPGFDLSGTGGIPPQTISDPIAWNIVDWDGELDPARPVNWPAWKKILNITCLIFMCLLSSFTSTVLAPAIPEMTASFKTTRPFPASFSLSVYVLGYATGPLFLFPLSEVYGRAIVSNICGIVFTLCTYFCGTASSWRVLSILRFFAGVGGGGVLAVAPSTIANLMAPDRRGLVMALMTLAYMVGPTIDPIFGSFANATWGWRKIFSVTALAAAVMLVLGFCCLMETNESVLLRRKTTRRRRETHNLALRSRIASGNSSHIRTIGRNMARPLKMVLIWPDF